MTRWTMTFLVLVATAVLFLGCAETQKETILKCPKCGAYFKTQEGADAFRYTTSPPNP